MLNRQRRNIYIRVVSQGRLPEARDIHTEGGTVSGKWLGEEVKEVYSRQKNLETVNF